MTEQLPFGLSEAGLTDYRSQEERDFLEALRIRAQAGGWYADAWPRSNCLTLSVVVDDPSTGQPLKTLRIDFNGKNMAVGYDATHQLVDEWDLSTPDDEGDRPSIHELATDVADWVEAQLAIDHTNVTIKS